ncbi:MAG: type II glyceraldehyde-3-phosphate dehydrogenase [Candidatus Thermoplasmatota archaeon]|nr:type II glyceraldehyde-3-phosphate dehydrogenase [Candidatus Thermoplasmatota archaeon]
MIKAAVNGFGTIGRRVAYALSLQEDISVTGIVKNTPDYVAKLASERYNIYVPDGKRMEAFEKEGIKVKGTLKDLLAASDVVVDCTPEGMGKENLELYKERKVRAIFQGGEEKDVADASFNAYSNFEESIGKNYVRVVSCNTTALARTLFPLQESFGISEVNATLLRRATDQNDSKKGPINAVEPSLKIPSHHAPDLRTVMHGLNVETVAIKVPTTLMHVHVVEVHLSKPAQLRDIMDSWEARRRIMLISGKDGRSSTAQVMDMAREMGRDRSDLYEIPIWKESVTLNGNRLRYIQAVHQESDVIPENVDAIRAMFSTASAADSIGRTDRSLSIKGRVI